MTRELVYSPEAIADLEEIFWFIAADSPKRARTYVDDIQKVCRSLCETPLIGADRPDLRQGVRILPVWRRIIIAYELPLGRVDILRVFSGGQDYEAILGSE